ncbi:class I SAM-dependent methyltransferase [Streptomyces sp. NPDC018019]|uniref:class I SAM-dependent methyltransferase n=1 Tax=Streptomyces sp. NPDC018019 TaxID=3365030 RepID=UPI0037A51927
MLSVDDTPALIQCSEPTTVPAPAIASPKRRAGDRARPAETRSAACLQSHQSALEQVGIETGWHVLDAGCGSGDFLPWLAELVGPQGQVSAVDRVAENTALAATHLRQYAPEHAVDVRQATVLDLPHADGTFDAVWCADVLQHLDDGQLVRAVQEMSRVVRPGGLVAVQVPDVTTVTVRPGDPFVFTDFLRATAPSCAYARQLLRSRDIHRWLREAGLASVRQHTTVIEHLAPLEPAALRFWTRTCSRLARQARGMGSGWEHRWAPFADADAADHPLRSRHGYVSEGATLAVGTVSPTKRVRVT